MMRNERIALVSAACMALVATAFGQRPGNWRVYKLADGLPELACSSVTISAQGLVLAKHFTIPFVSELDGYSVNPLHTPQGSSRIYGSPGGQLWTVTPAGLQELQEGNWVRHDVPEIARTLLKSPLSNLIPLYPVRQGFVLCLTPDALVEFNSGVSDRAGARVLRSARDSSLEAFLGMSPSRDGGLWIAGERGLAKVPGPLRNLKPETEWQEFRPPTGFKVQHLREPHEDVSGGVALIAESITNHQTSILYFDGSNWSALATGGARIRNAWRGPDGSWWAASINALFHSEIGKSELLETEELSARQYFDVALEPGGAFWLATSDGLFRFSLLAWRNPSWSRGPGSLIHCMTADSQDRVWFVSGGSLHLVQNDEHKEYPLQKGRFVQTANSIFPLKDRSVLLTDDEQLIQFHPATSNFTTIPLHQDTVSTRALGLLKDGRVCLASRQRGSPENKNFLDAFDGNELRPLGCPVPDVEIGFDISTLFEAQNGDIWIGTERGTACFHENKWKAFPSGDRTSPDSPITFLELSDGRIWCAMTDRIWQFDGRDWSEVKRGFDRINAMVLSHRDNSIWVASNGGLHRFFQGAWVDNGVEEGLPSNGVRAICEDSRKRLLAGTVQGLSLYDPDADKDPPHPQVEDFAANQKSIREGSTVTLRFSGQDKWKFTPRERLLYSYRLDEAEEWSPYQEARQAMLADLPAGKHYFQVRAMDRNCNVDSTRFDFTGVLAWYKETRLVLISAAGIALAFVFGALAVNRHRKLVRSYAAVEKKVAERTRELEAASRELLHSQKMNALGALAAGIAHDFNNILSIIKGSAQIIEDNVDNSEKIRTRVERIKTVVEQGASIVKAMLGFSRETAQQPASCDLNDVVQDTIKLLGDRFLREVQVHFEPAAELPLVTFPKDFLQQILLNFIFNAEEASDAPKEIFLTTRHLESLPAEMVLSPASGKSYVSVSVRDLGCGIPPQNMSRLFEPFFTTKAFSTRRGTGLGLSMVYELAKKIGAGLAVVSRVDEGSTFSLFLPIQTITHAQTTL